MAEQQNRERPSGKKPTTCWCGCGRTTMSSFFPGDDSKFHGLAKKVARGEADMPVNFVNADAEADFMKWHDAEKAKVESSSLPPAVDSGAAPETYGHYLASTKHEPGEHHFITMYLMPRLQKLPFLPHMPHWISPDGGKNQYGDIVYGGTKATNTHLAIEVKISYSGLQLKFTAGQYNLQISNARQSSSVPGKSVYRGDPDILIAAIPQGVAVVPWAIFRSRYLEKAVFPEGRPYDVVPGEKRDAPPFPHDQFTWYANGFVRFNKEFGDQWAEAEKELLILLEQACRPIWEQRRGPTRPSA